MAVEQIFELPDELHRCPHCKKIHIKTYACKAYVDAIPNQSTDLSNMVESPPHYTAGGIECIDAIMAAVTGLSPQEAVCVANVIKYTWRFKHKNGKQDLKKAEWYLKRLHDLQEG